MLGSVDTVKRTHNTVQPNNPDYYPTASIGTAPVGMAVPGWPKFEPPDAWSLDGLALTTRAHDLEEVKIGPGTSPASPTIPSARDVDKRARQDYALLSEAGELPDRGSDRTTHGLQLVAWAY
jgi:hypothetical protein